MKLKKLLNKIDYKLIKGNDDVEISDIAYDSRNVSDGYAFICIVGNNVDGHDYIDSAIKKGATAILIEESRYDEFKDVNAEEFSNIELIFVTLLVSNLSPKSKLVIAVYPQLLNILLMELVLLKSNIEISISSIL